MNSEPAKLSPLETEYLPNLRQPSAFYYILWTNMARAAPLKSSRNRPTTRELLFIARLAEMD
jgi:hypothetical protein